MSTKNVIAYAFAALLLAAGRVEAGMIYSNDSAGGAASGSRPFFTPELSSIALLTLALCALGLVDYSLFRRRRNKDKP